MKNFLLGVRSLGAGFGVILRSPRLLLLGALPALISTVLLLGLFGALLYFSGDLAAWMTPFADTWSQVWRESFRALVVVLTVGAAALLGLVSFVALTLLIGGPFYEYIAEQVERSHGFVESAHEPGWVRLLWRELRDAVLLVLVAVVVAVVVFAFGFVPVLGQTAGPVLGALCGAWLVALEMVGLVFQRRGLSLGQRHRCLRANRAAALGFGLPTYLLCLVPVAQLLVIPAAVVGGTLLAHRLLDSRSAEPQVSSAGGSAA